MARPGVSYYDVAQAANAIQAANEYPSIDRIRQKLGTGSSTTIANHLKQWKAEHMPSVVDVPKTTLPMPLLSQLQSFWDELRNSAQKAFEEKEAHYQQQIKSLTAKLAAHDSELEDAKVSANAQSKRINDLEQALEASQNNVNQHASGISQLKSDHSALNQTLEGKNETIASLQEQLSNVTSSLEYFHTAAQKQRDEETLKHASQVNRLEQTIQQLNQQKQADNERFQQLLLEHERSGFRVEQLELDTNQTKSELVSKIEESATHKAKLEESTTLISNLQASLGEKDQNLIKLEQKQRDLELQHNELTLKSQQLQSEMTAKDEIIGDLVDERDKLAQENEMLLQNSDKKHSK